MPIVDYSRSYLTVDTSVPNGALTLDDNTTFITLDDGTTLIVNS